MPAAEWVLGCLQVFQIAASCDLKGELLWRPLPSGNLSKIIPIQQRAAGNRVWHHWGIGGGIGQSGLAELRRFSGRL